MSDSDGHSKNIGSVGSFSLLFGAITGPGLVIIPWVFQTAGWLPTVAIFLLISFLTGLAGLFLIEAISKYPENAGFQRNVELTTLVYHFYGRRWHDVMQLSLYLSMQSITISSIVISAQTIDNFLVAVSGYSCGFQLAPTLDWVCARTVTQNASPFTGIMLFTYGYLLLIVVILPQTTMDLNDNVVIQFISFIIVSGIMFNWIIQFFLGGLQTSIPVIGDDVGQGLGNIIMNFAFVTAVPSWMAVKHPRVNTHNSVAWSIGMATAVYLILGLIGGSYRPVAKGSNILSLFQDPAINILFPLFSLITTIPVYFIIVRANLVQAKVCGRGWAAFWAAAFPLIISIPFQTGSFINDFMAYTSLIFTSLSNFVAPFLIYLFLDQRQSDDLITKMAIEDEEEIDETSAANDFRVSMEINLLRNGKSGTSMQGSRMLGSNMGLGGSNMGLGSSILRGSNVNFFNQNSNASKGPDGGRSLMDEVKGLTLNSIGANNQKERFNGSYMGGNQGIISGIGSGTNRVMGSHQSGLGGKNSQTRSNDSNKEQDNNNNREFKSNRTADDSDFSLSDEQSASEAFAITSKKVPLKSNVMAEVESSVVIGERVASLSSLNQIQNRIMSMSSLPSLQAKVNKLLSEDNLAKVVHPEVEIIERPPSRQIERAISPAQDQADGQGELREVKVDSEKGSVESMKGQQQQQFIVESIEDVNQDNSDSHPTTSIRWKEDGKTSLDKVKDSQGSLQQKSQSSASVKKDSEYSSTRQIPGLMLTQEGRIESIPILKLGDEVVDGSDDGLIGVPSRLPPLPKKSAAVDSPQTGGDFSFNMSVVSPEMNVKPVLHSKESFNMMENNQKETETAKPPENQDDPLPIKSPRGDENAMMKKRMTRASTSVKNFNKIAPGFFIDPYYDERTEFFSEFPILDNSLLNKVPEGQKAFQALPPKYRPRLVAQVSLAILSFLTMVVIIVDIIILFSPPKPSK